MRGAIFFSDLTRLGISVGGVAIAILLMLTLLGIYKGTLDQSTSYVNNVGADLWVAQAGAKDMFHTFSIVPLSLTDEIARIGGVSEVHPLISRPTLAPVRGRENTMTVVGYHTGTGVGGPWDIAEGQAPPGPDACTTLTAKSAARISCTTRRDMRERRPDIRGTLYY